jgi:hypothetical protein
MKIYRYTFFNKKFVELKDRRGEFEIRKVTRSMMCYNNGATFWEELEVIIEKPYIIYTGLKDLTESQKNKFREMMGK